MKMNWAAAHKWAAAQSVPRKADRYGEILVSSRWGPAHAGSTCRDDAVHVGIVDDQLAVDDLPTECPGLGHARCRDRAIAHARLDDPVDVRVHDARVGLRDRVEFARACAIGV